MQINVDGYGEQKTYAGSSFCLKLQRLSLVFGVLCLVFGARPLKETKNSIRMYTFPHTKIEDEVF